MQNVKPEKNRKKPLTFCRICGIIYKSPRESDKNSEKKLPEGVDKLAEIWYNEGVASRENEREELISSILKIEQCNQRGTLEDSVFAEETKQIQRQGET